MRNRERERGGSVGEGREKGRREEEKGEKKKKKSFEGRPTKWQYTSSISSFNRKVWIKAEKYERALARRLGEIQL